MVNKEHLKWAFIIIIPIQKCDSVQIDILEKFPVPFGLMRFGVAPDHVEVKVHKP